VSREGSDGLRRVNFSLKIYNFAYFRKKCHSKALIDIPATCMNAPQGFYHPCLSFLFLTLRAMLRNAALRRVLLMLLRVCALCI
jgi:hypothetical protein